MGVLWIGDNFNAEEPPAYFQQRIWDYDAMLRLLPSRKQPGAYVLARKKQFGPGLTEAAISTVYTNPDTCMCILNQTVPVCMVFRPVSGSWSPDGLVNTLRARDLWAHGGADKTCDLLEAQEAAEKKATRDAIRDDLYNRSGDAWRSYQARTGQSTIKFKDMYPSKTQDSPATGEVVAPTTTTGSRSTAGSGSRKSGLTIGRRRTKGKGRT